MIKIMYHNHTQHIGTRNSYELPDVSKRQKEINKPEQDKWAQQPTVFR
jgi:hypothetical protein